MAKESFIVGMDVWKFYGNFPALKGVSFEVEEGEFRCVVGPSGSGKTTLLSLIGGLEKISKGYLRVGPYELHKMSPGGLDKFRNEYVGFVFQLYYLIPRMTVLENVELPLIARGIGSSERRRMAMEALGLVGLAERAGAKPNQLSGGEQQRVAIARAIVSRPKLLLADEPTGNLDLKSAALVMDIFARLNREMGMTIVMVTHNLELTRYCTRISRLRDGVLVRTYEAWERSALISEMIS